MSYCEVFIFIGVIVVYKLFELYTYWWKKGVKIVGIPVPIFGNTAHHVLLNKSYANVFFSWYLKHKTNGFVGFYLSFKPYMLITDPHLSKKIFIDDFDHFSDRGFSDIGSACPLSVNLVTMETDRWKLLRDPIQVAMSGSKLRSLMPSWENSCNKLVESIKTNIKNKESSRIDGLLKNHLIEIFVTSCLGITYESFSQNSILMEVIHEIMYPTKLISIRSLIVVILPSLITALKWPRFEKYKVDYMKNFFAKLSEVRQKNTSNHRDLFLALAEIHSSDNVKNSLKDWKSMFVANSLMLTVAGFDTSHTVLSILFWELARHPDEQNKLYQDVKSSLERHGSWSYEALTDMPYMDAVIHEALRMYPPFSFAMRRCKGRYSLTSKGPVLEQDTIVFIPIESFHYDPEFFPDPHAFKPERFYKISMDKYKNKYIPFGRGPRNCIGYHFARIQMRLVIAILINQFKFNVGPDTPKTLSFHYTSISRKLHQKLHLYPELRTKNQV